MAFAQDLDVLVAPLDPAGHAAEIARLRACRTTADLDAVVAQGGWLTAGTRDPRLKLVKHGSGTFLVVRYEDGWSTRLSMAPFRER